MREIKFRAWDINDHLMYKWGHFNLQLLEGCKCHTVMQYTGLKDKNGVEIYEGDYVICPERRHLDEEGVVEYSHAGQYVLAQGSFKTSIHELVFNKWKLEVIGNIYENPELLTKGAV